MSKQIIDLKYIVYIYISLLFKTKTFKLNGAY